MTLKIDKNVPLPGTKQQIDFSEYPFVEMQVGDSFLLPKDIPANRPHYLVAKAKSMFSGRRHYTQRKTPEGFRVWRVN